MLHTSPKIISFLVVEKIFKEFYHIWAWWPAWSIVMTKTICIHFGQLIKRSHHMKLSSVGLAVSVKTIFKYIDGTPI